ncbi:MAG: TPM domain-containing protein [Gemmatimonadales bacterium]
MIGLALLLQITVPAPRGFVNDFAGVLDSQSVRHLEAVIAEVRQKTRGEIAVVTLPDIGDRAASDVALQIGRQWGVGDTGAAGDPAKNLGVVLLLVPLQDHKPGTGQVFIATGRGAEGFLTDARSGRIRDAMLPALRDEQYGPALVLGVDLIAQAFATEFGVTRPPPAPIPQPQPRIPVSWLVIAIILLIVLTRGRIFLLPFWLSGMGRGWGGRGRWGGGGGGGWGGGRGGGGFGGFGGGGGFSGGGAGGRF